MQRLRFHGYSLVELVAVVAIVGILCAIVVTRVADSRADAAAANGLSAVKAFNEAAVLLASAEQLNYAAFLASFYLSGIVPVVAASDPGFGGAATATYPLSTKTLPDVVRLSGLFALMQAETANANGGKLDGAVSSQFVRLYDVDLVLLTVPSGAKVGLYLKAR